MKNELISLINETKKRIKFFEEEGSMTTATFIQEHDLSCFQLALRLLNNGKDADIIFKAINHYDSAPRNQVYSILS